MLAGYGGQTRTEASVIVGGILVSFIYIALFLALLFSVGLPDHGVLGIVFNGWVLFGFLGLLTWCINYDAHAEQVRYVLGAKRKDQTGSE